MAETEDSTAVRRVNPWRFTGPVLRAALEVFETAQAPGHIEHLPFVWHQDPTTTDWHPPEPSPVAVWYKEQVRKQMKGGS